MHNDQKTIKELKKLVLTLKKEVATMKNKDLKFERDNRDNKRDIRILAKRMTRGYI